MIDVLVAGGGPVGLAAAINARLAGLSAAVVEPREDPVDKACGEGLMPGAVARLDELGVRPHGRPFAGIRYVSSATSVEHRFRAGPGLGVRRTELHAVLAARADTLGVERLRGRVESIEQRVDRVEAAGVRARWLLAADGLHSTVRRALGLDRHPTGPVRFGHRRHVDVAPWTDLVEVHWSPRAEAYVTPVAEDVVGVAVLGRPGRRYDEVLADFPLLAARIDGARPVSQVRGAGPLRQVAAARVHGRVLLVGDAAGYVDALTGEGISTGLATAAAAVACVAAGRPDDYEQAWRVATRRYRLLTGALLRVAEAPRLRRHIVAAASRVPKAFAGAVELLA